MKLYKNIYVYETIYMKLYKNVYETIKEYM